VGFENEPVPFLACPVSCSIDKAELQALVDREEQIENDEGIASLNSQIALLGDALTQADAAVKCRTTPRARRVRKPKSRKSR
jgi:hypothetical protein